ncbi:MAG TPA: HAMP domain-containing sensor histidine kinase [Gammaproteobacteria bacterium]|nr:HAMP domain-containing sensor histidine kinase [Gammaproteobacteria bacterium]
MSVLKNYSFWVLSWVLLVVIYIKSMQLGMSEKSWDGVIYSVQLMIDVCILLFSYLAYKNKSHAVLRKFYFLMFLSLIPGIFANEVYNVLINILGLKKINNGINVSWTLAYTAFLVIQIRAWVYLYSTHRQKNEGKTWITLFSYSQSVAIIFLSLISIVIFRHTILSEIGMTSVINSLLETALFTAISICLARTKSKALVYLATGFLLLIAFNLTHRFSYSTGHFFKVFDVIWLICLITIIFGLVKGWRDEQVVGFFNGDSLHVYASAIFLAFSAMLLVMFFVVDLILSSAIMNKAGYSNILPQNIPSMLIFSYTLAILLSKLVATYLSKPLEEISKRIDCVYEGKMDPSQILSKKFGINEMDRLDKFILKTVTELRTANRIKSDFLMNMSHDFRTPASGITSLSRSIYKKTENQTLKNLQKMVVNSSEQLMKFLDDVLDYSRLDSDQYKLNLSEVDVSSLIEDIVQFVTAKIKDKNLYIKTNFTDLPAKYIGDRLMLHRIILNIVSNAIKFTHTGGITISLDREVIDQGSFLAIKILDTGIGIDKKFHDFIFEPFNRVNPGGDSENSGIGLGLSNVSLMLKKMKGKIHLQSEIGRGSQFSVLLPI